MSLVNSLLYPVNLNIQFGKTNKLTAATWSGVIVIFLGTFCAVYAFCMRCLTLLCLARSSICCRVKLLWCLLKCLVCLARRLLCLVFCFFRALSVASRPLCAVLLPEEGQSKHLRHYPWPCPDETMHSFTTEGTLKSITRVSKHRRHMIAFILFMAQALRL